MIDRETAEGKSKHHAQGQARRQEKEGVPF
jgi:hypothetical protein